MRINTNISALNAHRQLGINTERGAGAMEKLSSGLRINRAGDDAAGLAISEKMRGQIRGLTQASRNAQDGISLIQTAEGALNETHSILQRMRELAVQSSTDTNTKVDRGEIQKEIDQLAEEITRIANTTEFNTQNLMGGPIKDRLGNFEAIFHIGANEAQNIKLVINDMSADALKVAGEPGVEFEVSAEETITAGATNNPAIESGEYNIIATGDETYGYAIMSEGKYVGVSEDGTKWNMLKDAADSLTTADTSGAIEVDFNDPVTSGVLDVEVTLAGDTSTGSVKVTGTASIGFEEAVLPSGEYTVAADGTNYELQDASGETVATSSDGKDWVTFGGEALFSVAEALAEGTEIEITSGGIDVSTQEVADKAITVINDAIETVSAERSKLGALQNRLEHTIANLGTSAENLQAAESRIRDLDMAAEIMEFTKSNILNQAATAMLAQANMAPQTVLQLLG